MVDSMPAILLSTLNARYFHSALGLRYLFANLVELQAKADIREFIISQRPLDIAEALLAEQPRIVGFGVYVWNVAETTQVVALLKRIRPELIVILGGPEVSHEWQEQSIVKRADYLITGQADWAFPQLCRRLLNDDPPAGRILAAEPPPLDRLTLPYRFYNDLAAPAYPRSPARRFDRWAAGRGFGQLRRRLQPVDRPRPARNPGRHPQAVARHPYRPAHRRLRSAL